MGFRRGLLKDKSAFFKACKSPIPKRRELLAKRPFLYANGPLLKNPFKLDRVSFSTPDLWTWQCRMWDTWMLWSPNDCVFAKLVGRHHGRRWWLSQWQFCYLRTIPTSNNISKNHKRLIWIKKRFKKNKNKKIYKIYNLNRLILN